MPAGRIEWGVEVRNTLVVPLTIRGLQTHSNGQALLITDERMHLAPDGSVGVAHLRPFAPVELAPGQSAFLGITARFHECRAAARAFGPGTSVVQRELWLDITVLGIPREARVDLPFRLAFHGPDEERCPAGIAAS